MGPAETSHMDCDAGGLFPRDVVTCSARARTGPPHREETERALQQDKKEVGVPPLGTPAAADEVAGQALHQELDGQRLKSAPKSGGVRQAFNSSDSETGEGMNSARLPNPGHRPGRGGVPREESWPDPQEPAWNGALSPYAKMQAMTTNDASQVSLCAQFCMCFW
jgi:hypothetical protein